MECSALWGFKINVRAAWLIQVPKTCCTQRTPGLTLFYLQECPSVLVPVANYLAGNDRCLRSMPNQLLLGMFLLHYVHRAFIYPFLIRGGKPTPFVVR